MGIKSVFSTMFIFGFFVMGLSPTPNVGGLAWADGSDVSLTEVSTLNQLTQVGQQLFEGKGQCAQCHTLKGASSAKGPSLDGIGAKLKREFIYESLVKPDAYVYLDFSKTPPAPYVDPMPATSLTEAEILAVIAYLQQSSGQVVSISLSELK